jgi:hypothetical protein
MTSRPLPSVHSLFELRFSASRLFSSLRQFIGNSVSSFFDRADSLSLLKQENRPVRNALDPVLMQAQRFEATQSGKCALAKLSNPIAVQVELLQQSQPAKSVRINAHNFVYLQINLF